MRRYFLPFLIAAFAFVVGSGVAAGIDVERRAALAGCNDVYDLHFGLGFTAKSRDGYRAQEE